MTFDFGGSTGLHGDITKADKKLEFRIVVALSSPTDLHSSRTMVDINSEVIYYAPWHIYLTLFAYISVLRFCHGVLDCVHVVSHWYDGGFDSGTTKNHCN